jgi:hypothetical protein
MYRPRLRGDIVPWLRGAVDRVSPGVGGPEDWRREIQFWKEAGVTHLTAHTTYASNHHKRIAGRSAAEHLAAITRCREAVADLL